MTAFVFKIIQDITQSITYLECSFKPEDENIKKNMLVLRGIYEVFCQKDRQYTQQDLVEILAHGLRLGDQLVFHNLSKSVFPILQNEMRLPIAKIANLLEETLSSEMSTEEFSAILNLAEECCYTPALHNQCTQDEEFVKLLLNFKRCEELIFIASDLKDMVRRRLFCKYIDYAVENKLEPILLKWHTLVVKLDDIIDLAEDIALVNISEDQQLKIFEMSRDTKAAEKEFTEAVAESIKDPIVKESDLPVRTPTPVVTDNKLQSQDVKMIKQPVPQQAIKNACNESRFSSRIDNAQWKKISEKFDDAEKSKFNDFFKFITELDSNKKFRPQVLVDSWEREYDKKYGRNPFHAFASRRGSQFANNNLRILFLAFVSDDYEKKLPDNNDKRLKDSPHGTRNRSCSI